MCGVYGTLLGANTAVVVPELASSFLNMLSVLESAIVLGTGRELPVVGFVGDTLVLGVIVSLHTDHASQKSE